jgi:hypothetical protein
MKAYIDKWDKQMILLCKGHFDVAGEDILITGLNVIFADRCQLHMKFIQLSDIWPWMLEIAEFGTYNIMLRVLTDLHPDAVWKFGLDKKEYDYDVVLIKVLATFIRHTEVKNFPEELGNKDRNIQELIMRELMK